MVGKEIISTQALAQPDLGVAETLRLLSFIVKAELQSGEKLTVLDDNEKLAKSFLDVLSYLQGINEGNYDAAIMAQQAWDKTTEFVQALAEYGYSGMEMPGAADKVLVVEADQMLAKPKDQVTGKSITTTELQMLMNQYVSRLQTTLREHGIVVPPKQR